MPNRPLKPCTVPGCPRRAVTGRCAVHARAAGRARTHWRQTYGDDWPDIRLDYLARHPRCALCPRMSAVADHYPVGIKRLRERRIVNPHNDRYLRPLCASCHNKETGRREPGGWNAR